ncbi:MAG: sugar ABC transporter substrate-binding protein [Isosphaeraceae bacterium]
MLLRNKFVSLVGLAFFSLSQLAGCGGGGNDKSGGAPLPPPGGAETAATAKTGAKRIGAVLPMFSHPFFVAQKEGLEQKAKELGFEIDIRDGQDDDTKQINQVDALLQKGIDLLILCPRDSEALVPAVESANKANVPVITLNRAVNGGKVVTYVGADDTAGGTSQGEALVKALGTKGGKIIYLQGTQGSSPQRSRKAGLDKVLASHKEITIADDRYADFQEDKAKSIMTDLVRRFKPGEIQAIVAQADEMGVPAAEVAKNEGWKDVVVIGFNGNRDGFDAIKNGTMTATILQDAAVQGRRSVEAAKEFFDGKSLEKLIYTELPVVNKSNIEKYKPAY